MTEPLLIAKNDEHELFLLPQMANRHGLITSATGTGKTVSLQSLAESFSRIGVPVFLSDIRREGAVEALAKSAARAIGSEVGRQIIRGVLGSLLGKQR